MNDYNVYKDCFFEKGRTCTSSLFVAGSYSAIRTAGICVKSLGMMS